MNDTVSEDVKLDDDKLREILAGCEGVTPGPWFYRPQMYDDWGWVRAAPPSDGGPGWLVATAKRGRDEQADEDDIHRATKTDPYGANAEHIARLDPQTVASIVTELLEARAYLAATKPPLAGADWTDTTGKQPVADDVVVRVRMRNGSEYEGRASNWDWKVFGENDVDIVAYSIVAPAPVVVTEDMRRWTAGALAGVHIAKAIPAVAAEYDFDYADECLCKLWAAMTGNSLKPPSPPMPGRGEGFDVEALRVAREVISDMVRYGIISNEVGTTAYYVGDNVLPTIMGRPLEPKGDKT